MVDAFGYPDISRPPITEVIACYLQTLYLHILVSVSVDFQFPLRAFVGITKRKEWTSRDSSLLRFSLTQTDCKYIQIIKMFTPSANFNQLLGRTPIKPKQER